MIYIAAALYAAIFILSITVATVALVNVYAMGTGADSPLTAGAYVMSMFVMPLLYLVCGWFIVMGGMLAVYLPLIPYIVFTFGAIGWFVAVIEMMVAAPLVALGVLSPSGQHELMGKAEPAIYMMLNIFLRPSLMLFGMIAAMLLSIVVVEFILNTFGLVMLFASGGTALTNPIVVVLFLTAMITLITSALNKCFTMIHIIPQQVMQWIGGHHVPGISGADEGLLGEVKGGVKSGASSVTGGAEKSIKGAAEQKQKKVAQAKSAQNATVSAVTGGAGGGAKSLVDKTIKKG
jgi:conjugal transfer/type IV secretion protein DotA/TraY